MPKSQSDIGRRPGYVLQLNRQVLYEPLHTLKAQGSKVILSYVTFILRTVKRMS